MTLFVPAVLTLAVTPTRTRADAAIAQKPSALTMPFTEVWGHEAPLRIAAESRVAITLPAIPAKKGHIIALRFQTRVNGYSGWNTFLGISINGALAEEKMKDGSSRILNRQAMMSTTYGTQVLASHHHYLTFFTQRMDWVDTAVTDTIQRLEGTWFVLRIDDLLPPKGETTVEFTNAYGNRQTYVEVASLSAGYVSEEQEIADGRPIATRMRFQSVWQHREPVRLGAGKSLELTFPSLREPGRGKLALRFQARLDYPIFEGWNTFLKLTLNGESLTETDKYVETRLLNRAPVFASKFGALALASGNRYITFFTPDIDRINVEWVTDETQRREATWYVLRIDDMVKKEGENTLGLENMALARYFDKSMLKDGDIFVEIKGLEVGYASPAPTSRGGVAPKDFTPKRRVKTPQYEVGLNANGGLRITVGRGTYYIDSEFSYPNKGWNSLSVEKDNGAGDTIWRPAVKSGKRMLTVTAEGGHYRLVRTIQCQNRYLEIHDAFTNKTADVLGVIVRNRLISEGRPVKLRVGGLMANPAFPVAQSRCASNPTLFVGTEEGGIGLFAEDTPFRNQLVMETDGNVALFGDDALGLAPRETYALRWRVYVTEDNEYFTFINRLRADLGVNYTILGPARFFYDIRDAYTTITPDELERYMDRQYAPLGILSPWFCYADGADLTPEGWLKGIRTAVANLSKGLPAEARLLPCFEIHIQAVPKEVEVRQWPADATKWPTADGFIVDKDGKYRPITEYTYGKPVLNYLSYLALNTNYYKKLMAGIDGAMDAGCRGVYFDIFSCEGMRTYDRWDGRTVEIAPVNLTVTQKAALLPILEAPAKKVLVDHIVRRGGVVVCNQYPVWEELQTAPIFSFYEINDIDFTPISKGHLAAPIGLSLSWYPGESPELHSGADLVAMVIARLKEGGLFYYYHTVIKETDVEAYELVKNLYPITIEELHSGWIKGKERTITCVPGRYKVKGEGRPEVVLFTKEGKRSQWRAETKRVGGGWLVDLTALPVGSIAVLVRAPASAAGRTQMTSGVKAAP